MLLPPPTQRIVFRKWTDRDIDDFSAMNLDPEVMQFYPSLLSREQTEVSMGAIKNQFEKMGYGLYVVEHRSTNQFMGYIGFSTPSFESFFTPCTEIGWRLKRNYWGQGLASEGGAACLAFGFSNLGLQKVFSFTAAVNFRSERVMNKIGMTKTGEFEHPKLPSDHWLRRHVLYCAGAPEN